MHSECRWGIFSMFDVAFERLRAREVLICVVWLCGGIAQWLIIIVKNYRIQKKTEAKQKLIQLLSPLLGPYAADVYFSPSTVVAGSTINRREQKKIQRDKRARSTIKSHSMAIVVCSAAAYFFLILSSSLFYLTVTNKGKNHTNPKLWECSSW